MSKPQRTLSSFANIRLQAVNRRTDVPETTMPWMHLGLGIAFVVCAVVPVVIWWVVT